MKKSTKRKSYEKSYGRREGAALFVAHCQLLDAGHGGDPVDIAAAEAVMNVLKAAFPKKP